MAERNALQVHDELVRMGDSHDALLKALRAKEHSPEEYDKRQAAITELAEKILAERDHLAKCKV
jgi:hypothetical protein